MRWRLKAYFNSLIGAFTVVMFRLMRLGNPDLLSNAGGWLMRRVGPRLPEHRVALANLKAAFPDRPPEDIQRIALGSWENLGRIGAEFAHLDRLWNHDPAHPERGRIVPSEKTYQRMMELRDDNKPALIFSAHLANWELAAVAAHLYGVDSSIVFRPPNVAAVADAVIRMRAGIMGKLIRTGLGMPVQAAEALSRGSHVGMLVDQYSTRGVDVNFFGRPARTSPLLARLAEHIDCPIYGVRVIRHGGTRFEVDVAGPMAAVRLPDGHVDVPATMQMVTAVVEQWVREHPEQWLWQHRRWR